MNKTKKVVACLLSVIMVVCTLPMGAISAFAGTTNHTVTVNAGENGTVKWNGQSGTSLDVTVEEGKSLSDAGVIVEANEGYQIDNYSFDAEVVQIAARHDHTAVLLSDGTVWTVGNNNYGQLGNGTRDYSKTFVQSKDSNGNYLTDVKAITAGYCHTVALKADGTVWAAGYNRDGQLGDGTTFNSKTFVQSNITDVKKISAGYCHTVALKTNGTVWSVGANGNGQLGDGTKDNKSTYVQPKDSNDEYLTEATAVSAIYDHTVVLKEDGTVWAVGFNNCGQLGDGTKDDKSTYVKSNITDVKEISTGYYHTVALKTNGTVWSVGHNYYGQLGDGTKDDKSTYVQSNITGVKELSAGYCHTVALKEDGTVWAVGNNDYGQLGDGTTNTKATFDQSKNITYVKSISSGNNYTVVLKEDGTVWAVGYNEYGQLGDGTTKTKTTYVKSNTPSVIKTSPADIVVTSDMTVNANISQIMYTVTFKDVNGKIMSEKKYPCYTLGSEVEIPNNTATISNENTHTTYAWGQITDVTKNKEYVEVASTKAHFTTGSYTSNGDATCTADGTKYGYCDVCNAKITVTDTGSALDHNYKTVVTGPTCTEKGYTTYTCTQCNVSYESDYVNALGHTLATAVRENEVPATCTDKGSYDSVVYCSVCNEELSRDTKEIDALGHNYKTIVTDPTCTEKGYTTHTCTHCKDTYVEDYVNALGHNYKKVVTAPTCTQKGYTTHTCDSCKDKYVDTYVKAIGHKYKSGKCTVCGAKDPNYQVKQTIKTAFSSKDLGISAIGKTYKLNATAKTKLTYKSSNTKVATVDKNGVVKIKGKGTATITVTAAATSKYAKAIKTVKIKVSRKLITYKTLYNVNYRTGAGTNYRVVDSISKGKKVYVLEKSEKKGNNGKTWVQIKVGGNYYWMQKDLLKKA